MDVQIGQHPLDEEAPGGMVINPHSALGKELRKWEQHRTELVPRGTHPGNPYVFREYPKMLYRAQRKPNGQFACILPMPDPYAYDKPDLYQRDVLMVESFNRSCSCIVADDSAERLKRGQGWALDPGAAVAQHEAEEQAIGNAAAEAAATAKRMSEKARAELAAADASTHQHVTDVSGVAKSRRGRKPTSKAVTAVEEA